ncbi:MAG: RNA polymerase-associated protein rapA [Sedimenticola sp.]
MFKKTPLSLAVAALLVLPVTAMAEIEVSGYVKNETAFHIQDGQRTGQATTTLDTASDDVGDVMKFENSARFFVNGDVGEESSFHVDINLIHDNKGVNSDYKGHRNYTQNDWIRELYMDTELGGWSARLGKQQVVWGTADGIKLLDMINPTDWREFVQNTAEDSRIPVWMANFERDVGESGNFQLIIAQPEENKIPGLNSGGDSGHPFIMKGVDTITGAVNGFLNIAPAMGKVAFFFADAGDGAANGVIANANLYNMYQGATVGEFSTNSTDATNFKGLCGGNSDANCLYNVANSSVMGQNNYVTNLSDVSINAGVGVNGADYTPANPSSTFELMDSATFATFYSFAGLTSEYRRDYPSNTSANLSFRYANNLDNGLNYSANYAYRYDSNPYVGVHWEDQSGNVLNTTYSNNNMVAIGMGMFAGTGTHTTVTLNDADSSAHDPVAEGVANLVFTERLNRVHNLGGALDYAMDMGGAPVVLRGEFIYEKDVKTPIIDKAALAIGDIEMGLTNEDADFFKYVIGLDVTVMTNLMISGQFIQFRNLDYVNTTSTPVRGGVTSQVSGAKYTGDAATLHLSNNLARAEENKEFISLFFSKPFGESQLGRWSNITMLEEGGGYWNRFDVEYSFSDQLVGNVELNTYWGDENTMFGQFQESSNIQLGVKYIFD